MELPKELTTVTPLSRRIALVLFFLLPIIGFFVGVKYQTQTKESIRDQINPPVVISSPTPTLSPEEPWKHYRNHEFGFAIDYPGDWKDPVMEWGQVNSTISFDNGFYITYGDFYDGQKKRAESLGEVVEDYSLYHEVTDIKLAGKVGKKLVSGTTSDDGGVEYILPGIYIIGYNLPDGAISTESSNEKLQQTFDRMLASLYFADKNGDINPIDQSRKGHMYENEDYSFQYPDNWVERQGTGCPSFQPVKGRYTFTVCLYYRDTFTIEDKLNILPRNGFTEVSRKEIEIDSHKGIEQLVKVDENYYDKFIYVGGIDNKSRIFEITVEGVPPEERDSDFALIDKIIGTMKLKFPD